MIIEEYDESLFIQRFENMKRVIEIYQSPRKTYKGGKTPLWQHFQMRVGNETGRGMVGKSS